jgi:predicted Rdx family selenoprotein
VGAAQDLLANYQHIIESLTLTTGSKGVFDVTVDGAVLFSKYATGRHARSQEILEFFESVYARDVERYGT